MDKKIKFLLHFAKVDSDDIEYIEAIPSEYIYDFALFCKYEPIEWDTYKDLVLDYIQRKIEDSEGDDTAVAFWKGTIEKRAKQMFIQRYEHTKLPDTFTL